jgi:hypothetical protein
MEGLAKLQVTTEIQTRVSNPHISCELRGNIRSVPGIKQLYPHIAEEKLEKNLWSVWSKKEENLCLPLMPQSLVCL